LFPVGDSSPEFRADPISGPFRAHSAPAGAVSGAGSAIAAAIFRWTNIRWAVVIRALSEVYSSNRISVRPTAIFSRPNVRFRRSLLFRTTQALKAATRKADLFLSLSDDQRRLLVGAMLKKEHLFHCPIGRV
jgi:hypothetical protein